MKLIVIVDDSLLDSYLIEKIAYISNFQGKIITFEEGIQLLEYLDKPNSIAPNVIFLDINMPFMNGYDVLVELEKKEEQIKNTKIAIITSSDYKKDMDIYLNHKLVNKFISKPVDISTVIELLNGNV